MSTLSRIFEAAHRRPPTGMRSWLQREERLLAEYVQRWPTAELSATVLASAVFVFDHTYERVAVAYAVSTPPLHQRNAARMRGFPDVNVGVRKLLGESARPYDRGHFLGHACGGDLDINLFPHERALNRGWSREGKEFRALERSAASAVGRLFYHAASYDDDTWIPVRLEYGIMDRFGGWQAGRFQNR